MTGKIADVRQSYIDGRFVVGEGAPRLVDNPYTEEVIAEVETVSLGQVKSTILAARRSFDDEGHAVLAAALGVTLGQLLPG